MLITYEFKTNMVYYHLNLKTDASEDPPREEINEHFKYEMDLNKHKDDNFLDNLVGEISAADLMQVHRHS